MRYSAKVIDVDEVNVVISMTMPAKDWSLVADQLDSTEWPSWQVASAIREAVREFEGKFYGEIGGEK